LRMHVRKSKQFLVSRCDHVSGVLNSANLVALFEVLQIFPSRLLSAIYNPKS
jgi:hypothetical protein